MKRLFVGLILTALHLSAQLTTIPNTDFPTFRTNLNNSLANGVGLNGSYSNPSWITSMAFAKLSGIPSFARTDQSNTWTTGVQDFSGASHLRVPVAAGYTPTANGHFGFDSTSGTYKGFFGSLIKTFAFLDSNITGNAGNVTGIVVPGNGGSGVANTATHTLGTSNINWATLGTGLIFNTTTTGAKRVATATDVVNLFGSGSNCFLKNDGTCAAAGIGDMLAATYYTVSFGPPSNPCPTFGRINLDTTPSPADLYFCSSNGGSWLGPFFQNDPSTSGALMLKGLTSGGAGFVAMNTAGTLILYAMPVWDGSAVLTGKTLIDSGPCSGPLTVTLALTSVTCHQLAWISPGAANPQTSTYQVLAADFTSYKTIPVASGTFTITLVASGAQPLNGQFITIVNYGAGTVTVARSGQNINGGTGSITLPPASATATSSVRIYSDGTNYVAQTYSVPCSYDSTNGLQCGTGTTLQSFLGGTSGSIALTVDDIAGTGTWKLPPNAGTDYLAGRADTKTFTNTTYDTAGTGNSFLINGLAATANTGTGPVVRGTSPTLSAPLLSGSSSGSTIIQASATASGTITVPAATDTLMGKATTDTPTNKTLNTGGTGNHIQIGGLDLPSTAGLAGQRVLVNSGATAYINKGFTVTCSGITAPPTALTDSTTAAQTFGGSCTIPANALAPGQNVIIDTIFTFTTSTGPSAITYTMQIDGVDAYKTVSAAHTASTTSRGNSGHFIIGTDVALGASVAVEVGGSMSLAAFAPLSSNNSVVQPLTLDTTASHTVTFLATYAAANNNQSATLRRIIAYAAF